ncbi:hypothetical protein EI94DRAFT_1709625 [Lactarius quietus]|nr:hypothetical protein EI94DRAFT_1709625 [Lactarius quietus]
MHIPKVNVVPLDIPRADKVHWCLLKDHKVHVRLLKAGKVPTYLRVNKVHMCLLRTLKLLPQDSQAPISMVNSNGHTLNSCRHPGSTNVPCCWTQDSNLCSNSPSGKMQLKDQTPIIQATVTKAFSLLHASLVLKQAFPDVLLTNKFLQDALSTVAPMQRITKLSSHLARELMEKSLERFQRQWSHWYQPGMMVEIYKLALSNGNLNPAQVPSAPSIDLSTLED